MKNSIDWSWTRGCVTRENENRRVLTETWCPGDVGEKEKKKMVSNGVRSLAAVVAIDVAVGKVRVGVLRDFYNI